MNTVQVSDHPLMTVEPDERGSFIAVGSENGNATILELSHHLVDLQRNEKNIFLNVRVCRGVDVKR